MKFPDPNSTVIELVERTNTFRKSGREWALNIRLERSNYFTLRCWEKKPSKAAILETLTIFERSCEIYVNAIKFNRPLICSADKVFSDWEKSIKG